jgi:hypothetical protein
VQRIQIVVVSITLFLSGFVSLTGDTSASATALASCSASAVHVAFSGFLGGAGSENDLFWVTNVADRSCALRGYPDVTFLGPHAVQLSVKVTNAANRDYNDLGGLKRGEALPTVALAAHGGVASFMIYGTDEQHGSPPTTCIETRKMLVTLPNMRQQDTVLARVGSAFYWCGGITVHPLVPGRTGADPPIPLLHR